MSMTLFKILPQDQQTQLIRNNLESIHKSLTSAASEIQDLLDAVGTGDFNNYDLSCLSDTIHSDMTDAEHCLTNFDECVDWDDAHRQEHPDLYEDEDNADNDTETPIVE